MKSMEFKLTETEVRVLGSLIEKDITTPEYYPLSLNALVNACNQKSNRDPVMQLDEDAVRDALEGLQQQRLAGPARGADSRVTKYEQRLQEVFNFTRPEIAVLCVLLLRGPQTPGRTPRTRRAHAPLRNAGGRAIGIAEIDAARTAAGEGAAAPAGNERISICASARRGCGGSGSAGARQARRLSAIRQMRSASRGLEEEVAELRREVSEVKDQLERFRKQFE